MMIYTNMRETADLLGVTYSALQAAVFHKKIPEPAMKIGSHKLFNAEEVENARNYFASIKKRKRRVK